MTPAFTVRTTPRFERLFRALRKAHPELRTLQTELLTMLSDDPYNRSGRYPIKKLTGVGPGQGQYRLRLRRFRFRYDIDGATVVLHTCGLRREDTYR